VPNYRIEVGETKKQSQGQLEFWAQGKPKQQASS
jgi:hypothetical protein